METGLQLLNLYMLDMQDIKWNMRAFKFFWIDKRNKNECREFKTTCPTIRWDCFLVPELELRESPRLQWRLQLSLMRSLWPGGDGARRKHKSGHDKTSTLRENTKPCHVNQAQCKCNLGAAFVFRKEERRCITTAFQPHDLMRRYTGANLYCWRH